MYDLAERLEVEVRFCEGKSLGGMYARTSNVIFIPADRPAGRQAFTCAHELGHWFFGHGTRIDETADLELLDEEDPKEQLANMFAGYLLMPPWAVKEVFAQRNWKLSSCEPLEVYVAANQLAVGYGTLVHHLQWSLGAISSHHASVLLKVRPKVLRERLVGKPAPPHLVIADLAWTGVPIDLQVGDSALLPKASIVEGSSVEATGDHNLGVLIRALRPGISRAATPDHTWAVFIRVSRRNFVGRNLFRHLEDPDVDGAA